jgi:predicted DNA-binding protein with PD1-like motif
MRTMICVIMLGIAGSFMLAQQTRTEVTKAVSTVEDSKPNSGNVPDVIALNGQFSRVLVLRFKYDADLLAGLEKKVKEEEIKNAVILAGIGSIRNYNFHVVSNRTFPSKNVYVSDPTGPADITGMNGYIIDGRVHAHLTMSNADRAFGGHLENGTTVYTFAIVTLGILADGIDLSKVDDKTYR